MSFFFNTVMNALREPITITSLMKQKESAYYVFSLHDLPINDIAIDYLLDGPDDDKNGPLSIGELVKIFYEFKVLHIHFFSWMHDFFFSFFM